MDVNNFYLLLDLSIDPPEENPEIIEQAIQQKQSEWSRFRNHPTKSSLAQKNIDLLPKIREVMRDPKLRKREALKAKQLLLQREKLKFTTMDRHVAILFSKGLISRPELAKLAALHGVSPKEMQARFESKRRNLLIKRQALRLLASGKTTSKNIAKLAKRLRADRAKLGEWIRTQQQENDKKIGQYVERCSFRGFIHESEITFLGRLYHASRDAIVKRIDFPVKKNVSGKEKQVQPIEKTIERLINDKLRIVEKTNLYDFLGLPLETDLETLRQRAQEREMEFRKIGQKDAITTASCALAGHAISLFKTAENRRRYDASLVHSRLGELDEELNAAGVAQRIWPEYADMIADRAVGFGMDIDDAYDYIFAYAKGKKWKIEKKPLNPERKRAILLWSSTATAVVLLTVSSVLGIIHLKESRLNAAYETAIGEAEKLPELEGREVILSSFLRQFPESKYTEDMHQRLKTLRRQIHERDTQAAISEADAAIAEGNLERARDIFEGYLNSYANTTGGAEIKKRLTELFGRIDERDFQDVAAMPVENYEGRSQAFRLYLDRHPDGAFVEKGRELVQASVDHHFAALEKEVKACGEDEQLENCIALCNRFVERFANTPRADEVEGIKQKFLNRIQRYADLSEMRKKAEAMGEDFEGARLIYLDYIEANPEITSALKKMIVTEINALDRKIETQKQIEKEWKEAYAASQDLRNRLDIRVKKLKGFIEKYPTSKFVADAQPLLDQLLKQKLSEEDRQRQEREKREYDEAMSMAANTAIGLEERTLRLQRYIGSATNPNHVKSAETVLAKLRELLAAEREQERQRQSLMARRERELARVASVVRDSGGRLGDNRNGTFSDRQSGLTWTMLDAYSDTSRCMDYASAQQYVQDLKTGGFSDWRLPTTKELEGMVAQYPGLPSDLINWLWSSETFWHGWNKKVFVFVRQQGRWTKNSVGIQQCGSVIAVRQ